MALSSSLGPMGNTKTSVLPPVCEDEKASLSFYLPRLNPRAPRRLTLLNSQIALDTEEDGPPVAFIEMVHTHHHHHHLEDENIIETMKNEWKSLLLLSLCFVSITIAIIVVLVYFSDTNESPSDNSIPL